MSNAQPIVAQGYRGHRLMYVRKVAEASLDAGREPVLFLAAGSLESPEFQSHLADLPDDINVIEWDPSDVGQLSQVISATARWPTVFTEGDPWVSRLAWRWSKWPKGARLVVMRGAGQPSSRLRQNLETLLKMAMRQAARRHRGVKVLVLVSATAQKVGRHEIADIAQISLIPELVSKIRGQWAVDAPRDTFWVGIVGGIGPRKNVHLVAEALSQCEFPVGLVLAGRAEVDEDVVARWSATLRERGAPVIRVDRSLSDSDFDATLAALDCVVLAHTNEGPSGVLAKAQLVGTRVVAAGAVSLREDIKPLGENARWVRLDSDDLTRAIGEARRSDAIGTQATPRQASFGSRLI